MGRGIFNSLWIKEWRSARECIFFNVFIDDLVNQLRTMGRGARVGNSFVGCIVYADDISLLRLVYRSCWMPVVTLSIADC